ncbi:MAG: hypothetical protein AAFQ12_01295 [Pseudomonadota bacterium]
MAAKRKSDLHETGDAKMKAAALKYAAKEPRVKPLDDRETVTPVPSPAKQLQDQLQAHYQPLTKQMPVILVSLLVAFAFVGGWVGANGVAAFV